jgi:triacylglycerol esterase/lipase EstA (alpha/beta hydrolase family)
MAGPIVTTLVSAVEGAVVVGGVSALAAALTKLGVKKEDAVEYESALKADKYVLLVHGSAADQDKAQTILSNADA